MQNNLLATPGLAIAAAVIIGGVIMLIREIVEIRNLTLADDDLIVRLLCRRTGIYRSKEGWIRARENNQSDIQLFGMKNHVSLVIGFLVFTTSLIGAVVLGWKEMMLQVELFLASIVSIFISVPHFFLRQAFFRKAVKELRNKCSDAKRVKRKHV
jgi:hypothetical protein